MGSEKKETSHDELGESGSLIADKNKMDFAEYLKNMGMKDYEHGTVIFYEEEYDTNNARALSPSKSLSHDETLPHEVNFDEEMLAQLFDPDPTKQIRVSKETHRRAKANNSSLMSNSNYLIEPQGLAIDNLRPEINDN